MIKRKRVFTRDKSYRAEFLPSSMTRIVLLAVIVIVVISIAVGASVLDQHQNGESSRSVSDSIEAENSSELLKQQEEYELWYNKPRVKPVVQVEAGIESVDVSLFLIDQEEKGYFVGDLSAIDLRKPGEYDVSVQAGPQVYASKLVVVDTIPPKLTCKNLIVPLTNTLRPEDFVESVEDATEVTLSFREEPQIGEVGVQKLTIVAVDLGGNKTSADCQVTFVWIKDEITVEAGRKTPLTVDEFLLGDQLPEGMTLVSNLKKVRFDRVGRQAIEFDWKGNGLLSYVSVVDTVMPTATAVNRTTYTGVPLKASQFVKDVRDVTKVDIRFVKQPDFKQAGKTTVEIDIVDEGKNRLRLSAQLTVIADTTPPVLYGVKDWTYYKGDQPTFMTGVYAKDDYDPKPTVQVDYSRINENIPGTYMIVYTARDASGNTTSKTAQATVKHHPPYKPQRSTGNVQLDQLCDSVLSQIVHGDMSKYEQGRQAMLWIGRTFRYRTQTNRTDWIAGAIRGLSQRTGDCFIHQFSNRALLTRLGIPNYAMKNDGETHSWVMVTLGGRTFVSDAIKRYNFLYGRSLEEAQKLGPEGTFRWSGAQEKTMKEVIVVQDIPFNTVEVEDPTLLIGQRVVKQEGVDGKKELTYDVEYIDGVERSRTLRTTKVITEPIDKIIRVGTQEPPPTTTTITTATTTETTTEATTTATESSSSPTSPSSQSTETPTSPSSQSTEATTPSTGPTSEDDPIPTPTPEPTTAG